MTAAYPSALLNWTARVNSQTVQSADPNTLAAEIDAIEAFVGVNPHIEPSPLNGAPSTFSSLSARVTSAYLGTGHPFAQISQSAFNVSHSASLIFGPGAPVSHLVGPKGTSYPVMFGTGGNMFIRDTGLWLINANVAWDYATSGWVQHLLYVGASQARRSVFNYSQFPGSGSNNFGERFINEFGMTETTWLGRVNAGTIIKVGFQNCTNRNPIRVENYTLNAYFLRN